LLLRSRSPILRVKSKTQTPNTHKPSKTEKKEKKKIQKKKRGQLNILSEITTVPGLSGEQTLINKDII